MLSLSLILSVVEAIVVQLAEINEKPCDLVLRGIWLNANVLEPKEEENEERMLTLYVVPGTN